VFTARELTQAKKIVETVQEALRATSDSLSS
jgi:hypothetical protein